MTWLALFIVIAPVAAGALFILGAELLDSWQEARVGTVLVCIWMASVFYLIFALGSGRL